MPSGAGAAAFGRAGCGRAAELVSGALVGGRGAALADAPVGGDTGTVRASCGDFAGGEAGRGAGTVSAARAAAASAPALG